LAALPVVRGHAVLAGVEQSALRELGNGGVGLLVGEAKGEGDVLGGGQASIVLRGEAEQVDPRLEKIAG
jgi:hypothetical protein